MNEDRPISEAEAIRRVMEAWNRSVPRGRVRRLNHYRLIMVRQVLAEYTVEEVEEAVEWYGRQPWQRDRGAWKAFDDWMTVPVVTRWWESAREHHERVSLRRAQQARDALAAQQEAADGEREADTGIPPDVGASWRAARAAVDDLPDDERAALLDEAAAALPAWQARYEKCILARAVAILHDRPRPAEREGPT